MKIGIFAPSSACNPERHGAALRQACDLGHQVLEGHSATVNYGKKTFLFSSDSIEHRIAALEKLLADPEVKLLFAARGGYGALELLPLLAAIKQSLGTTSVKTQKFISGISDFSVLLLALDGVEGLSLVHGPGFLDAFLDYDSDQSRKKSTDNLFEMVSGSWAGYPNLSLNPVKNLAVATERFSGNVTGGNLSVLASLVGTGFLPNFDQRILFLEETGEKPYRVHRALTQLKFAGLLDNLAGVILGDFRQCSHVNDLGPDIEDVLENIFSTFKYPVFKGFPGGHQQLNLPLPFGVPLVVSKSGILPG